MRFEPAEGMGFDYNVPIPAAGSRGFRGILNGIGWSVIMVVRVELARILIRETDDTHIVELREVEGTRTFPIVIGLTEAAAIERRLMGQTPPRPQTHELLANIVDRLGYNLDRVVINDLREHTFFARLYLTRDGEEIDIDSRPSDAIALGAASDVAIYVEEHVLEEVRREE